MTCKICGAEIPENETRCPKCGTAIETEPAAQPAEAAEAAETPRGFSNKRNFLIIVIALVVLLIGGAVTAVAVTRGGTQSAESIMTLAERYLKEEKYEQAVIEFQRVIELDPMNVDAYLNLAEAYTGLGNNEKALEVLRQGLEATGDSRLQAKIDELTKPAESSGTVQTGSSTSDTTSTPAEQPDDEPKATREYDEQNRLVWEYVTSPDGTITDTNYGEYQDEDGNVTGWGITNKWVERIDENGDTIQVSNCSYGDDGTLENEEQYNDRGDIIKDYSISYYWDDVEGDVSKEKIETTTHTYKYEYGPFGTLSKVETVVEAREEETQTTVTTTNYTYDAGGKLISKAETTVYKRWDGETDTSDVYTTNYTYNAAGKRISETETGSDGHRLSTTEYKYDADGHRISRTETDANGRRIYSTEYKYNADGRRIEQHSQIHLDGSLTQEIIETWKYNDAGKRIEHYQSDRRDLNRESKFWDEDISIDKWDDAGKRIEQTMRNTYDGQLEREVSHTIRRDANGKTIEVNDSKKYPDHTKVQTSTSTYNGNERVIHTTITTTYTDGRAPKTSESVTTWVYEYDELGHVILETGHDEDGNFVGKTEYEY